MPFVNILGLKHLTRFVSCFCLVAAWFLRTRDANDRIVLIHGVHSPFLFATLFLCKLLQIKIVTIISDPPGVMLPGDGKIIRLLRSIDRAIISKALCSMDGLIALTSQLSKFYAPQKPSVVVEGILSADDLAAHIDESQSDLKNESSVFTILYAGLLKAEYGLELLLQAFFRLDDPCFKLLILGRGEYEEAIRKASEQDSRIIFKGFCDQHIVKELMKKTTVLINPRPAKQDFTHFSFPSKTIEYMITGRPVLSTRLPGIPNEYFRYLYVIDDETPEGLSNLFLRLKAISADQLSAFGAVAKSFVMNNKNELVQGRKIINFLNNITFR
ncbi:MAG: glycosyltransferase [Desulforhopalus sp.]